MKNTLILTSAGMLAAISAVFQIVHIGYLSPWGMWIDFVAVPWILAYFLFGWRGALTVSIVSSLVITFVDPSTWLGAFMKFAATLPMWFIPFVWQKFSKLKLNDFRKLQIVVISVFLAITLRTLIVIPLNYYYAIPIWTGMPPSQAMSLVPWWAIFLMNAAQGVMEFVIAWMLVFRFKLERFAIWE
jgi:riboflavin transporter FmnP